MASPQALKDTTTKTSEIFSVEYYGKKVGCKLQLTIQILACTFSTTTENVGPLYCNDLQWVTVSRSAYSGECASAGRLLALSHSLFIVSVDFDKLQTIEICAHDYTCTETNGSKTR